MKINLKSFFAGALTTAILMAAVTVFAESVQTIEAVFGRVRLNVNNAPVEHETLLYNGTTYVPIRAVAEMLGMEVGWDETTRTAYINGRQTSTTPGTASNEPGSTPGENTDNASQNIIENENGKNSDIPFTLEMLDYEFGIFYSDGDGYVYLETYYKNRTPYTIKYFAVTWHDKTEGLEYIISSNENVKPDGVSNIFSGIGPKSRKKDDIELIETRVTFINPYGEDTYLTYDHLKQEYKITGRW